MKKKSIFHFKPAKLFEENRYYISLTANFTHKIYIKRLTRYMQKTNHGNK